MSLKGNDEARIDQTLFREICATVELYTKHLGWASDASIEAIEGAVIDEIHQMIFEGPAPSDFAVSEYRLSSETGRKALTTSLAGNTNAYKETLERWQ